MREVSRLSALTVVLLLTGPATALAQQRGGSVPEEFVRAMVGADAGLLIGELPEDLAGILPLPDGSRVIGSVTHDAMSIAYVSVAADPDTAVAFFRDQMVVEAGWRMPEEREPPRGFQRPAAERASASFCGPSGELLSVSAAETGTETIARVQYYPEFPGRLPCDRPSRVERWNELEPRLPILKCAPGRVSARNGNGQRSRLELDRGRAELGANRCRDRGWHRRADHRRGLDAGLLRG